MPSTPSSHGAGPAPSHRSLAGVVIGTWNVSWWSEARLPLIEPLGASLFALQETKLVSRLEQARSSLKRRGYTLHHGCAALSRPTTTANTASSGVGILASPGVAVSPFTPDGASWKRIFAMARACAVQIPPRPDLPRGLRIFSVYGPLQRDPAHVPFTEAFLDTMALLDMQVPTLFMGDFNGTVAPDRDYPSGEGSVCPLLIIGPWWTST